MNFLSLNNVTIYQFKINTVLDLKMIAENYNLTSEQRLHHFCSWKTMYPPSLKFFKSTKFIHTNRIKWMVKIHYSLKLRHQRTEKQHQWPLAEKKGTSKYIIMSFIELYHINMLGDPIVFYVVSFSGHSTQLQLRNVFQYVCNYLEACAPKLTSMSLWTRVYIYTSTLETMT